MKRILKEAVIDNLLKSKLWQNKIKNDCINQNVFFTIRNNRIDLYHKGGLLFTFDETGFKTHIKYAAVIGSDDDDQQNYLTESDLEKLKIPSYYSGYGRIKENCSKYSGVEAAGVSALYHNHSYLSEKDMVVLDIEVSLKSIEGEGKKQDRVDVVLLNKKTGTIQFVEAKHFSNKELWRPKEKPAVTKQIKRYEGQVKMRRNDLLTEYQEYVKCINDIFTLSLPGPTAIDDRVTLLIFGFDNDQKKGRLDKFINLNNLFEGVKIYQKGNIKKFEMHALWKGLVL
jgi:hypothetical protein